MPLFRVPGDQELQQMERGVIIGLLAVGVPGLILGVIAISEGQAWGWMVTVPAALGAAAGGVLLARRRRH